MVKNLPANTGVRDSILGQEDPLEKEIASRSSILAWEIPQTEEPGGLQSIGSQKSWTQLRLSNSGKEQWEDVSFFFFSLCSERKTWAGSWRRD